MCVSLVAAVFDVVHAAEHDGQVVISARYGVGIVIAVSGFTVLARVDRNLRDVGLEESDFVVLSADGANRDR